MSKTTIQEPQVSWSISKNMIQSWGMMSNNEGHNCHGKGPRRKLWTGAHTQNVFSVDGKAVQMIVKSLVGI